MAHRPTVRSAGSGADAGAVNRRQNLAPHHPTDGRTTVRGRASPPLPRLMSLDELFGRARRLVDDGATPALQLAVARDGELVAFETFGAATNETRFCVFSTTKPVVASVVWQLL